MRCQVCGTENSTDARFCANCGATIEESTEHVQQQEGVPVPPAGTPDPTFGAPPKRRLSVPLLAAAALAFVLLVAGITFAFGLWGGIIMPEVEGMSLADARAALAERGIMQPEVEYKASYEDRDTVLKQEPESGARTDANSVKLTVSTPPTIPADILSMDPEEARELLESYDLDVTVIEYASIDPGKIDYVSPKEGTEVSKGEMVFLYVTRKPEIPDILGYDMLAAESALYLEGLVSEFIYVEDEGARDTVIDVSPSPGTSLDFGDTVKVTISTGVSRNYFEFASMTGERVHEKLTSRDYEIVWHISTGDSDDNIVYFLPTSTDGEYVAIGSGYPWAGMISKGDDTEDLADTSKPDSSTVYPSLFAMWVDSSLSADIDGLIKVMDDCGVSNLFDYFVNVRGTQIAGIGKTDDRVWTIGIDSEDHFIAFGYAPESVFERVFGDQMWVFDTEDAMNMLSVYALGFV